ncbi:DUF2334 domain-containing protein [Anaerobaca lacustris]|uniref:DUF2334 domain-containing protein n=1 Tax=Anaerobaca lacustris TaxID=3044600 RepID=A0AAW6U4I7_9BACT|nr:DUF2334 domain-containing protein [Sedimentisphaerales bacterium M17dextr]
MSFKNYLSMCLLFCCLPVVAETDTRAKQIRVVFRFDDPSATSDAGIETRLIEAFRKHGMCCTYAVIPFRSAKNVHDPASQEELPLPRDKADIFADAARAGVLEIALHGYSHQTNGMQETGHSEFAGLPYEDQLHKIQAGREFLETVLGLPVTIFVPPWNTYDASTLKALESTQFRCLSADRYGVAHLATPLAFLPCTSGIAGVQEAVLSARAAPDAEPVIVVLFHQYDFYEIGDARGVVTFEQFLETLQWLDQQSDVAVVPMSEVSDLNIDRYLANQRIAQIGPRLLPRMLRAQTQYPQVLLSEEAAHKLWDIQRPVLRLVGFYGSLMVVVGITAFIAAGMFLTKCSVLASRLLLFSGPFLLGCSLIYAFQTGQFGGRIRMLVAMVGAAAYCVGICAARMRRYISGLEPMPVK